MAKKRIQYRYDGNRNRIGMTDPDGGRFTYAYDNMNRMTQVINPQNERTTYAYDANGRRTLKQLANGTRASFTYDGANNITRLANLKSDSTTISSFDYQYDKTGNRTAVLEADGSRVTWSYDNTYQLLSEHRTGSNGYRNTFTYDAAGNRTLKNEDGARTTYAYDAASQLETAQAAAGTTTYAYDANGNQQLVQEPSGARTTTLWDDENRTTLVQLPTGVRNTMAYDPDGLRIKLEESTGTKKFVWDDQNYLAETNVTDTTQAVYTNEPQTYGNLISQRRGSTTNYYHFDALGSTRELTDASEGATDTYLYDAWGNLVFSTGSNPNPFRYVGELGYYTDNETDTMYVRARVYIPFIGRWTSIAPLQCDASAGQYLYSLTSTSALSGLLTNGCPSLCPSGCNCDFDPKLFECKRGVTIFPIQPGGPHCSPDRNFPDYFRYLDQKKFWTFRDVSFPPPQDIQSCNCCCTEDWKIGIGYVRCTRKILLNCPGQVHRNDRSAPFNFLLFSTVRVVKTNRTCCNATLPDETCYQQCALLPGVLVNTPHSCGFSFTIPHGCGDPHPSSSVCDWHSRLPWGEPGPGGRNPCYKCPSPRPPPPPLPCKCQ